jgi:hypothetical protein
MPLVKIPSWQETLGEGLTGFAKGQVWRSAQQEKMRRRELELLKQYSEMRKMGVPHSELESMAIFDDISGSLDKLGQAKFRTAGKMDPTGKLKNFEIATGTPASERGTPEYIEKYHKYLRETAETSPMLKFYIENMQRKGRVEAGNLRKEFYATPDVKQFFEIRFRYDVFQEAMRESERTKNFVAVDQAIITTFNKMTDPDSVVRESEYARTAGDLALWNRLKGKISKWKAGGAGLTQADRVSMFRMATNFKKAAQKRYNDKFREYRGYYTNIGVDPNAYLNPDAAPEMALEPSVPQPGVAPPPTEDYDLEWDGTKFIRR